MPINNENIRPSALAGSWYDADPVKLHNVIEMYLNHARISHNLGKVIGLISPHAGYMYSGPVAAYAYKQIRNKKYDTIIVIATNHGDPRLNFSSVLTRGGYETPLGTLFVDEEIAKAIVDFDESDDVRESELGHLTGSARGMEHSLEIQLPFLQVVAGDFKLVPIVMGSHSEKSCASLANAIARAVKDKNVLLVGSTDLSHFFNAAEAQRLDNIVREHVEAFDPEGFLKANMSEGRNLACGAGPMAAVMMACRQLGAVKATVLNMANSGNITGDNDRVVGYMSAALSIPGVQGEDEEEEEEVGVNLGLTDEEKKVLNNVVEKTLEVVVNGGELPGFNNFNGNLGKKLGAFVTLTKNGKLRGCIGHIVGTEPLILTVAAMTKAAALDDWRFPKVQPSELSDIEFEISVLTPIREIKDINEIVVGRDGIIISKGKNRGLLLPQVGADYGWDRITFLEQTCNKAQLPLNAWKDKDTKIEIFSAEIIK